MRVFVTGATGFVGSAVVRELLAAGHEVIGLVHSDAGAKSVIAAGAKAHRGDLEDLESLRSGAAMADGVVHTAFIHDFSKFKAVCETDRLAIEAFGSAPSHANRPLVVTSGVALANPGRLATEDDVSVLDSAAMPRVASEEAAAAVAARGVRVSVVRLPIVHGDGDGPHSFVRTLISIAREKGVSAYIGEGKNRWPAGHQRDVAILYRLAFEKAAAGLNRFHAVAEEGIPCRDIAEVIGQRLNIPVVSKSPAEAADHFGWFAHFAAMDGPASSELTRERLKWHPKQPGLIADLERSKGYFET
jgi:nucleoside-diphosphate-sugar epimerase